MILAKPEIKCVDFEWMGDLYHGEPEICRSGDQLQLTLTFSLRDPIPPAVISVFPLQDRFSLISSHPFHIYFFTCYCESLSQQDRDGLIALAYRLKDSRPLAETQQRDLSFLKKSVMDSWIAYYKVFPWYQGIPITVGGERLVVNDLYCIDENRKEGEVMLFLYGNEKRSWKNPSGRKSCLGKYNCRTGRSELPARKAEKWEELWLDTLDLLEARFDLPASFRRSQNRVLEILEIRDPVLT